MSVITNCRSITGSVTFASGFDPDNSVNERRTSVQCGMRSEASTLDIAPISPRVTDVLDTRATLVDDEVGRESTGREGRGESLV